MPSPGPHDLQVIQLVCSRLCHDLVGPVGAVNAAVELMEEFGTGMDDDASALLSRSAGEARRKLSFFRAAFGFGGGDAATQAMDELRSLTEGMLVGGKVSVRWSGAPPPSLPTNVAKLAMLMVLIGTESLPRGGEVTVHIHPLQEGLGVACVAEGPGAALNEATSIALGGACTAETLSARNVHAYYACMLAAHCGTQVEIGESDAAINLALLLPSSGS